jgi:hypothetical protein
MYDDDDDNQFNDNNSGGTDAVSQLRAANKAQAKRVKELEGLLETATTANTELTSKVNAVTVSDILKAKGVDPGISKFLKDVEPTEDSINTWLAENGKFIGYDPTKGSDEGDGGKAAGEQEASVSPEMAELQAAMARVQAQEANAAPGLASGDKPLESLARLGQNAKSFEDVEKGLRDLGMLG